MFPNRTVYIYFLLPIKVKYLVMFLVATEFILSMNSASDISHITHLSGVLIGYIYLRYFWRLKDIKFSIRKYFTELNFSIKNKIKYLTLYAFSTENWKRPNLEIKFLLNLLESFLKDKINDLNDNGIKIKI